MVQVSVLQHIQTAIGDNVNQTLAAIERFRCSAILRTQLPHAVLPALQAAVDGGFRVIECTLNTPGALDAIARFAARDELVVGAGTVLSIEDARRAVDAGASFIVSPVFDPAVVHWCRDHDIVSIPGTSTPTEMWNAHREGADILKIFPGPNGGPDWVRAVRGPLPDLRIFPTAGVTEANAADFLAAGAFGVGFVQCLFEPGDLAAGSYKRIEERAARMVQAVEVAD